MTTLEQQSQAEQLIEDLGTLRHMLGVGEHIAKRSWGYRNRFIAGDRHHSLASLARLKAKGLVEQAGEDYYFATLNGMRVIGLNEKQIKRAMES